MDRSHLANRIREIGAEKQPGETLAKVGDWLSAGSRLVWVIDPERRLARVYRQDGSAAMLGEDDALDGEDILPGFACNLNVILEASA